MEKGVIAISGQPGAGSTTVAKILARKLNLKHFSPGSVFKDVAKNKIETQHYYPEFKQLCGKHNLIIPRMPPNSTVADVWKTEFGKQKELHNVIDYLQKKLSQENNIIIDGKLSLLMLKNANVKVWLKASPEKRAVRTSLRESLDIESVKKLIPLREKFEREEWKKIYGVDYWEQEKSADIVIDTSEISPSAVAKIIINKINQ